jgi:hypothetical protein
MSSGIMSRTEQIMKELQKQREEARDTNACGRTVEALLAKPSSHATDNALAVAWEHLAHALANDNGGVMIISGYCVDASVCCARVLQLSPEHTPTWLLLGVLLQNKRVRRDRLAWRTKSRCDDIPCLSEIEKSDTVVVSGNTMTSLDCFGRLLSLEPGDTVIWSDVLSQMSPTDTLTIRGVKVTRGECLMRLRSLALSAQAADHGRL